MKQYLKIIIYSLLLVAGSLAYINTITNDFVYDDASVLKDNRYLKNFSNIKDIFSKEDYFARSGVAKYKRYGEATYRPVVTISYFIDFALFGENPMGSHAMNLIYHLIQIIVLFKLIFLITNNRNLSLLASLLFAVHPIGSEAINAISFREDILCCLFFCLSLFYYIKYVKTNFKLAVNLFISLFFYLCSCLSKENGFVLPIIILLYNHFIYYNFSVNQFKNTFARFKKSYFLFALTAITFLIIRFVIFNYQSVDDITTSHQNLSTAIIRFFNILLFYFRIILLPDKLSPAYNVGFLENAWYLSISIPFFAGLMFVIYYFRSKIPFISFSLLWYLITLAPVSGLIYLQHPVAERYLYMPSIGIISFVAFLIVKFIRNFKFKISVLTVILVLFISRSIIQNTVWSNEFSLWDYTVKLAPKNYNALANYAVVLADKGNLQDSIVYYKKALAVDDRAQSHYNLANTYARLGLKEKAKESYRMSIALDPNYSEAHNNLSKIYGEEGKYLEAISEIKIALKLNPYNAQAYNNLGVCLNQIKRYNEAIDALKKAIQLNPGYVNAHFNLGSSYFSNGEYDKAEQVMRFVVSVDPDNKAAQDYLQFILDSAKTRGSNLQQNIVPSNQSESNELNEETKRLSKPEPLYENSIQKSEHNSFKLDKADISGFLKQGDLFMESRNYIEALKMYRTALRHSEDNKEVYFKLVNCYIKLGSFQLAKKQLNEVLRLSPNNAQAKRMLADVDRILGNK